MQPRIILASRSPKRAELLAKLGVAFEVIPAHVDETVLKNEAPLAYVRRVARAKALKVAEDNAGTVVIAADTPVIVGRRILQTPETADEAADMLGLQSGRRVHIPTVLVVIGADGKMREKTVPGWVKYRVLKKAEIMAFVATNGWCGVSGALKIDTMDCDHWLTQMQGTISGISGLPLYETQLLLRAAGVRV